MSKTKKDTVHPGGRPSDFKVEYCGMLFDHMSAGHSLESFAHKVKCSYKTLYNWIRDYPEFLQAFEMGKSAGLYHWESVCIDGVKMAGAST